MANKPVSIPQLGGLDQAITLAVSDAGWRAMLDLVDDAKRPGAQLLGTLYLRRHNCRIEFLFLDQDRLAIVYPDVHTKDDQGTDFSIEVDPAAFAGRPSGDGELIVVPITAGGYTFTVAVGGAEIGLAETNGLTRRWNGWVADNVGDRVVTCPTERLSRAIDDVMEASERPNLGRIGVDSGGLVVSSAEPAFARVPIGSSQHTETVNINLHSLKWMIEHFHDETVQLLLPAEGWSALAVATDRAFALIRIPDPFAGERKHLGKLLDAVVTKLPQDNLGRYFMGVRGADTRLYCDVVGARVDDSTSGTHIRLSVAVGDHQDQVSLESRLDLYSTNPDSLRLAIEAISDEAVRAALPNDAAEIWDSQVAQYREHLTAAQCNTLLHHSHWIPINRGWTAAYVADNFPGWTWNEIVKVFIAAGIHVRKGGPSAKVDDRVASFHFSSASEFRVEWIDGSEPADIAARRQANDLSQGHWAFDAGGGATVASLGGWGPPR